MAGTAVVLALAAALTLSLSPATRAAAPRLIYGLFAIIALTVLLFAALIVEVDATEIRVKRCEMLRTRIWWGWGLHWTPSGWLYNVGGRDAVRVVLAHERPIIIGSDEAARLKAAIDARLAARQR